MDTLLAQHLNTAIDSFKIFRENGEPVWAPYLRNGIYEQRPNVPRGLGKSYPNEIQEAVNYIDSIFPGLSANDVRKKLISGELENTAMNYKGIDCSGFIFVVFEYIYKHYLGRDFCDILYCPKAEVLRGALHYDEWLDAYKISPEEAESLPELVTLNWVVSTYKRKPINLVNVRSLSNTSSSDIVSVKNIVVGDVVRFGSKKSEIPHIAVIVKVTKNEVTIAHSTESAPVVGGGVTKSTLQIDGDTLRHPDSRSPYIVESVHRYKGM